MTTALVIGAGPAGLMAAEELARAGWQVVVAEAKPSPARKFLMAGKSGLNLTKAEGLGDFIAQYGSAADWLAPMLQAFGPDQVQAWARDLGQPVFTGSTGRVFPTVMKGSPLLRAWLARLADGGVALRTRWRWSGFSGPALCFDTPEGVQLMTPQRTVLALGGASWARLGSDGAWAPLLAAQGVALSPFEPANAGLSVSWSPHMSRHFGQPLKGAQLRAGPLTSRGEIVLSSRGIEGGGIYPLTPELRAGARLHIDLFPDLEPAALARRMQGRPKDSMTSLLRRAGLAPVAQALARECTRPLPTAPEQLAATLKDLLLRHSGPRPLDEAISTAGGIPQTALAPGLQLRALPGIHAAGEMLDWEAPTGGYLLTACLATGRWAGRAAAGLDPALP